MKRDVSHRARIDLTAVRFADPCQSERERRDSRASFMRRGSVFGQFSLAAIFLKPSIKIVRRRSTGRYAGTNLPCWPSAFVVEIALPSQAIIDRTLV
jgi:hypothetical protein